MVINSTEKSVHDNLLRTCKFRGNSLRFPVADSHTVVQVGREKKTLCEYLGGSLSQGRVKMKNSLSEKLLNELETCTAALENIQKLTTQSQVEDVLSMIENLLQCLPGPITVQKLLGIDEPFTVSNFITCYEIFLESLIKLFDLSFPFRENKLYEPIKNLFSIDDPVCFSVNLRVLSKYLKSGDKDYLIQLLTLVLKSEGLFSYICVIVCNSYSGISWEDHTSNWSIFQNLLYSLPMRIANVSERNISEFFQTENYSKFLILNLLKVVEFTVHLNQNILQNKSLDCKILSVLLSKILVHFNASLSSKSLLSFIEIVGLLTNKPSAKTLHYQNIFRNIFTNLERPAVEVLAKVMFCNLNPQKYLVVSILGNDMINNANWKFVLCTKIPMLVHFEKDYDNLLLNLVLYLSVASQKSLIKLFIDLINIWADRTSITHTSVEQQIFVSKLILYILNSLQNIGLSDFEKSKIMATVYAGLPVHLESSVTVVRYSGMKTGEILLNILRHEDKAVDTAQLKFEYENLTDECKNIVNDLKHIIDKDLEPYFKKRVEFDVKIEDLLENLKEQNVQYPEYIPPERRFRSRKATEEPKNEVTLLEYNVNPQIKILDSTNFELDSDDDLVPYDLSNHVKVSKKKPPAYLRDLRDALLETEDYELFTLALQNCQNIIVSQLPDDDAAIGLEILTILISLEQRFYVEHFDDLLFQSCISITCTYPAYYAEYLCKQIHADVGTYSISKRVFMMDVLRQSAKGLASLKMNENVEPTKSKSQHDIDNAADVIRKRLESKTRYFKRHKFVKKESINSFSKVAGYFFFPLLYGFNQNKMLSQSSNDIDFIFLIHFVETLAVIMSAAQNCLLAPRMGKEAFQFSWFLRFHKEVKVRMAIISLIASVILNVPQSILVQEFMGELFEIRLWLADLLSSSVARGEPNTECRNLAACAMVLIEGVLKVDVDVDNN